MILRNDILVSKEIMYATINVLNSCFFYNAGMHHGEYLVHKALRYRFNKKKEEDVLGEKTPKTLN